ncbi:uncharacterized protein LOC107821405 isoform X5 [Nicotiana tabacum]|uniref:Uncharacterized protein LOC107821405 isoform X5 n=1 Tax=Nicotiana tabacum TaxID=4097 RepID=A0AC58SKQ2_TOBAC
MDRYQKVEKARRAEESIKENEIRVTAQGLIRNYISYATTLLQDQRTKEIVLKAMGQAISKTVAVAEIIKKRIPGLYQDTSISSTTITDAYEPIEEGLQPLEITRQVSLITITLSTVELDKSSPGYQAPSDYDQSKAENQHLQQAKQVYVPSDGNQAISFPSIILSIAIIHMVAVVVVEVEVGAEVEGEEGDVAGVVMETTTKMMADIIIQVEVVDLQIMVEIIIQVEVVDLQIMVEIIIQVGVVDLQIMVDIITQAEVAVEVEVGDTVVMA